MNRNQGTSLLFYVLVLFIFLTSCEYYVQPVNPNASKEAVELLNYFYSIKGKVMVAGQHNVLGKMSEVNEKVFQLTGTYPAMWGSDFGFADSTHDIDNIAYRKFLVPEIIKQHERGAIITLTYHQANPLIGGKSLLLLALLCMKSGKCRWINLLFT